MLLLKGQRGQNALKDTQKRLKVAESAKLSKATGFRKFVGLALSRFRQPNKANSIVRLNPNPPSRFRVEQLEPRLLLSGDLVPQSDLTASSQDQSDSAIVLVEEQPSSENITIDLTAWNSETPETRNPTPETSVTSGEWRVEHGTIHHSLLRCSPLLPGRSASPAVAAYPGCAASRQTP